MFDFYFLSYNKKWATQKTNLSDEALNQNNIEIFRKGNTFRNVGNKEKNHRRHLSRRGTIPSL
jgi:hypothetical protein